MSWISPTAGRSSWRWFSAARLLILAQVLVTAIATIWHLPAAYQNLLLFKPTLGFQGWSENQLQAAVQTSGMPLSGLVSLMFAASIICLLSFWAVAGLLAWRKSDTWMGLLIIYALASTAPGFSFLGSNAQESALDFFGIYQKISATLVWPSFFLLFYLFPDGRFTPRWTRWLGPLPYLAFTLPWLIDPKSIFMTLLQWLMIFYAVGGIASQLYRYRRESGPAQRQQTKWVVYALGVLVVSLVVTQGALLLDSGLSIGTRGRFWFDLVGNYLFGTLLATLIPLSIGISILRYRLWDIDLIIRRTLLYALLSGLLGLVYFGSVVLLRQVMGGLTGESSAALVISTLLIAALFTPLRRRLQTAIDRRFFRQKYDTARALENFNAASRSQVVLSEISGQLVHVVHETVQPESVSLWMRKERS